MILTSLPQPRVSSCDLHRMLDQAQDAAEGLEYAIAHDLRTPLRAVAASARILLEELGPSLGAAHRDLLETQARNAAHYGRLIDGLLELSRLNRARTRRRRVDVTTLVRRLAPKATVEPGLSVDGDPALVERAIGCLLDNARKFSNDGLVDVRREGRAVAVVDGGIRFDPVHAARIFQPFERLVGEEFAGCGMGLALVDRIVRLHGGRVQAVAIPEGGAVFTIDFAG